MKKKILLLVLLLTVFLTLPTICNAEEVPPLKWEDISLDKGDAIRHGGLYNINNDLLVVHNTGSGEKYQYIRLYNSNGEKKWEYKQGTVELSFLINNDYVGLINYTWKENEKSILTLLNIKNGTVYKEIDISKLIKSIEKYSLYNFAYYYNNKILSFIWHANNYSLYTIDLDGNIELLKTGPFDVDYYSYHLIAIDNIIYSIDKNNIIAISSDTGEVISTTPIKTTINIKNLIKYKDGIMFAGSKDGYMALEYYDLKTGNLQTKQFEEEGIITSMSTDNKDNLYIAGQYIDENTTGQAYFAKYTINNWNFQKAYESIYENDQYDEYLYTDILAIKNNKILLSGTTDDFGKYREGLNFVVFYDGTKNYKIDKVIKGNGHLEIVESEVEDNEVKYQVKPGFGYKLISLKIVTASGKEIEVSDDYSFIMPNENITITATFEPIINNPITSNNIIKILLELTISIPTIYLINKNIKNKKYNN